MISILFVSMRQTNSIHQPSNVILEQAWKKLKPPINSLRRNGRFGLTRVAEAKWAARLHRLFGPHWTILCFFPHFGRPTGKQCLVYAVCITGTEVNFRASFIFDHSNLLNRASTFQDRILVACFWQPWL
jgi:hypothetical protein